MSWKLGSLFDGLGTCPLAWRMLGCEPVWASEIEAFPIAVTKSQFPNMKHLGDIRNINGAEIEQVDVICFGSPCQDLSVAGLQRGLVEGERSNLFFEAMRIMREMREATNGRYPRIILWENVPGALSSGRDKKGSDFRQVLQEFARLAEGEDCCTIPQPKKWETAGGFVGDGYSVAWRILDSQWFGVPQRRRRLFACVDLGGNRAGKILLEQKGMPRDFEPSGAAWEGTAVDAEGSIDGSDTTC